MALIVQKYGGTSVGSVDRIKNIARKLVAFKKQGHDLVVVVSAMSGETNRLLSLVNEIQENPDKRELDVILSTGEQVTIGLLSLAIKELGYKAKSYTGWQVKISTDSSHFKARITHIDDERIKKDLEDGIIVVVAGFQGIDGIGDITTLGRGGSDTTGVALAAALNAEECQIYTDVDGVYTADPRIVPNAKKLDYITFEEMIELSSLGSKVLQIRSVELAGKHRLKLRVLSSLMENPGNGTLISYEEEDNNNMEKAVISGITYDKDQARINIFDVPNKPGIAYQILGAISDANINVDMIIQNIGYEKDYTDFSFTVSRSEYPNAINILENVKDSIGNFEVQGNSSVAKISIVGVGMRSHSGIATTMFKTLASEGINIQMISTSEIKVSVLIEEKYLELAVRSLHKAFNLDK